VGGYPRVFSVASADVDLLAQCVPGQKVRFRRISIEEAWVAAKMKRDYTIFLRARWMHNREERLIWSLLG